MKEENTIILKYLGSRLRTFREDRGISRDNAAEMIGVTKRTLASYERGEREINMDTVQKLAVAYKTTVTNLTNYDNVLNEIRA